MKDKHKAVKIFAKIKKETNCSDIEAAVLTLCECLIKAPKLKLKLKRKAPNLKPEEKNYRLN